ncbi:hypothetical protein [Bordetella bronchiseptica]|uniref:hypothetical protein n=1 Tax=Bordetella bronchiseptica TaxID=518 RepID=UPI0005285A1A|nr:hypothetical protein [Bordetella bronchiseptica]AZW31503.1 hypothetical protein CS343_15150 [Bordetella bronchiseptica]
MSELDNDLFVEPDVFTRPVTVADGSVRTFHFRKYSGAAYAAHISAAASRDPLVREAAVPHLVAASLCDEDGASVITVAQACRLKPTVLAALYREVTAINAPPSVEAEKKD